MIESFEAEVNQQLNDARDKSGNIALEDLSNSNRLRNMVQAGSKGNNINIKLKKKTTLENLLVMVFCNHRVLKNN